MNIYIIIALSLLITQSQCSTCTKQPDDSLVLVAETDEFISRSIPELFKSSLEDFTIADQKEILTIVPTLQLLYSNRYTLQQPANIQAIKIFRDSLTEQSFNQYIYMEVKADRISYISNSPLQGSQVRLDITYHYWESQDDVGTLSCFDLDFITTDIQIIDCLVKPTVPGDLINFVTVIYTRTTESTDRLQLQTFNPQQYKTATSTIMKTSGNYIYRGVPHYALDNEQSAIDIMLYNNNPQEVGLIASLNSQVLAQLLNQPTYELYMVDFRITSGLNIALLNRNGDVIHVKYTENTQKWALIKYFNTKIELLAFDYDFYSNRFVGVSAQQTVYADGPTYNFPTNLAKPKVFFTLSYVIVATPTKLYHFGNTSPIPVSYDMDPYYWIIADQKQNDFLYYGEKEMRKYLLNYQSTLRLFSKTVMAEKSTSITQKLDQGQVCVLKVKLSILEKATYQIVPIHDPQYFLPYGIDWAYFAVDHNRVFEGPNLKFSSSTKDGVPAVTLEFATHGQYKFEAIPNQDKITYIKFFIQSMGQILYIVQTNDLKVQIYDCQQNLNATVCKLRTSFPLTVQMNEQNTQISFSSGIATLFVLESTKQVSAYLLVSIVNQPTIFGKITDGDYVQIKLGYDQLFALNVQTQMVTSFKIKNTTTYPLQITIDENFMLERGYKTWTPEVLGAGELKYVLAVFDSENKLTIISYKNSPNCYIIAQQDDFRYQGIVERVLDVMGDKVIAVVRFENKSVSIFVENIEDEANVYKQRTIFLQRFAFEKLNYQSSQNIAYLTTLTSLKQTNVVLVLDLERIALSTIYTTIDCDQNTLISAHNNYVLIQTKTTTSANQIDKDLSIWARNSVKSDKYLENVVTPIKVNSDDFEFSYQQTLKIVNTYKSIQIDKNQATITSLEQLKSRTQDACYDLGLDFAKGNTITYKATCTQCVPGNVKLTPPLVQGEKICSGGIDVQNLNENQFVVLYGDKFTLVQKETLKFVDFKFENEFTCKKMEIIDQGFFVWCSFSTTKQEVLIRYKCVTNVCLRSGASIIFPNDVVQYKYIDNYLFVGSASQMQIYYIASLDKFDEVVLVKETQIKLRRFAITKIGVNSYQLYMIQTDEYLNLQTQTLNKEVATNVENKLFSLYDLVTEASYYVGKNTNFNGLFNLNQEVEQSPQLLFTTSDVAQYAIKFQFTCAQDQCTIMTVTIPFILSPYGYWNTNANPQVSISKKYIAMSYENLGSRAVVVYKNKAPADKTIPVLSIGGLEDPLFAQDNQVLLYEFKGDTKFIATSGIPNNLSEYTIMDTLQICLKGEIYDQVVSVNVKNDFGTAVLPVNIGLIQENDASKSLWWVWLLVALVIVGGAFGFYWYKKKQQKKVDNYGPLS